MIADVDVFRATEVSCRSWRQPKVSVAIPVFNGAEYLGAAIESVLAQSYKNLEILVINDGSTDGGATERVAEAYGERIRYFAQENGGVSSALNAAAGAMSGDYFCWLSHDDLFCADKIAVQIEALRQIADSRAVVYGDFEVFTENPEMAVAVELSGVSWEHFRYWLAIQSGLHGCTVLLPKSVFVECGGFNESLRTTQDYEFWFRVARTYRFHHIRHILVKARSHSKQGTVVIAAIAHLEACALAGRMVADLTVEEVTRYENKPLAEAYFSLARRLWRRGFSRAGDEAALVARRNGLRCGAVVCGRSISILQAKLLGALRSNFSPPARLAFRRALRRIQRWLAFFVRRQNSL